MAHSQVTVVLKGSRAEFRSHGPESDSFAEYLCKLFDQSNNPGMAKDVLVAKAGLGDAVLQLRRSQQEKMELLKAVADREETKSRNTALSWELRQLANDRAFAAREEARRLASELGQ